MNSRQEVQNEVTCMNDLRDFQDAEVSTQWTIPRYQSTSVFPSSLDPGGMPSRLGGLTAELQ